MTSTWEETKQRKVRKRRHRVFRGGGQRRFPALSKDSEREQGPEGSELWAV